MINWTRRHVGVSAVVTLICSTAMATDLNVSVTSGGSGTVAVVSCGAPLTFEVTGVLSDIDNLGLAGFVFDLEFTGGPLELAEAPSAVPMLNFDRPAGMTAAGGFGGTVFGGRLRLVGGAQNTMNNTVTPFPVGSVITGVAQTETVLVTGSVVTPVEPGTYTLSLSNLRATVLVGDDQATGYWMVEPASVGTITNLTIQVLPAQAPATASNNGPACAGQGVTLHGGPDGMAGYSWTGPGGFTSNEQDPVVSPVVPGVYTLTITDSNHCIDAARTKVALTPGACDPFVDCNNNAVYDGCEVDTDGDGLIDGCDNCPYVVNADQQDDDGDGAGNACDNCLNLPNADQADNDGDGVGNACDNCPNHANTGQNDSDNDGKGDACDNCPNHANADQADSDGDGTGDACEPRPCDIDHDGDVDRCDLNVVLSGRAQPSSGPNDPRDLDGDGWITVMDARICIKWCDTPRCSSCIP